MVNIWRNSIKSVVTTYRDAPIDYHRLRNISSIPAATIRHIFKCVREKTYFHSLLTSRSLYSFKLLYRSGADRGKLLQKKARHKALQFSWRVQNSLSISKINCQFKPSRMVKIFYQIFENVAAVNYAPKRIISSQD